MGILTKWRCSVRWRHAALGLMGVGVVAGAFCWGRCGSLPQAAAKQPTAAPAPAAAESDNQVPADYSTRAVAQIYGSIIITREQLGEYLIARYGDRVENLVNKRVIEEYCKRQNIEVSDAEVQTAFNEDIKKLGVTARDFVDKVLTRYGKTAYEWKEDVIRPKLLMHKLVRAQVVVTPEDLQNAYDSYYGSKVDCQMIMWPAKEVNNVRDNVYPKIRDNKEEFDRVARTQASPRLASVAGRLDKPISHHSTGCDQIEQRAFTLHENEVSEVFQVEDWVVVLKCLQHIPPDPKRPTLEEKRQELTDEVIVKKVDLLTPDVFKKMHDEAQVHIFIKPAAFTEELVRRADEILNSKAPPQNTKAGLPGTLPPHSN